MPRNPKNTPRAPPGLPASTFILDNGGHSIKAGFAPSRLQSDDQSLQNCHLIPNALAKTKDRRTYIGAHLDDPTIQWNDAAFRRPIEHGQLVSWEAEKEIWDLSFFDEKTAQQDLLIKQPEDTTLILTEAPNALPTLQKNADEIIMEEWEFGGYSRLAGASLNAYNDLHPLFGDKSANVLDSIAALPLECLLVIDSGFSHTIITPIYKGRPLQRAIRRLDFGGKHLTSLLREVISIRHADLHQDVKVVNDIKEDVCYVSQNFKDDLDRTWARNTGCQKATTTATNTPNEDAMDVDSPLLQPGEMIDYILPDFVTRMRGLALPHSPTAALIREQKRKLNPFAPADDDITLTLGNERFTIPEIIFTPSDIGSRQPGLAECVMQSLSVLPPLIQATMLANTLVVGGNARLSGFIERLQGELRMLANSDYVVRVRRMGDPVTSTWLGGARMASNRDVVRQYGITREEYLEHGSAWLARKFAGLESR